MTDKLADKLDYNARTLAALARWADTGARKPKPNYSKWKKKRATKAKRLL